MRLPIVLCFAFGCGFESRAASDGGLSSGDSTTQRDARPLDTTPPDAAVLDSSGPGAEGANDCFQHWIDGSLHFTELRQMTELSSNSTERDPWISEDGLRLYFSRDPGPHGGSDLYLATRASLTARFGVVGDLVNLNAASDEDRAALSDDELTIVLARDPGGSNGKAHIVLAQRDQRSAPFPSPNETLTQAINAENEDHLDPFLSRDGLRLYLALTQGAVDRRQIMMATRPGTTLAFVTPAVVRGVDRNNASDADPALSGDERILLFSSTDLGVTNLWYATRPSSTDPFRTPVPVPALNSVAGDSDPMLSADGCELYFSSNRSGARHIYHAVVTR